MDGRHLVYLDGDSLFPWWASHPDWGGLLGGQWLAERQFISQ